MLQKLASMVFIGDEAKIMELANKVRKNFWQFFFVVFAVISLYTLKTYLDHELFDAFIIGIVMAIFLYWFAIRKLIDQRNLLNRYVNFVEFNPDSIVFTRFEFTSLFGSIKKSEIRDLITSEKISIIGAGQNYIKINKTGRAVLLIHNGREFAIADFIFAEYDSLLSKFNAFHWSGQEIKNSLHSNTVLTVYLRNATRLYQRRFYFGAFYFSVIDFLSVVLRLKIYISLPLVLLTFGSFIFTFLLPFKRDIARLGHFVEHIDINDSIITIGTVSVMNVAGFLNYPSTSFEMPLSDFILHT